MCGDLILSLWYIVLKIKTNRQVCQSPQIRSILRLSARVESAPVESESGGFAVCCVALCFVVVLRCVALCCVVLCCVTHLPRLGCEVSCFALLCCRCEMLGQWWILNNTTSTKKKYGFMQTKWIKIRFVCSTAESDATPHLKRGPLGGLHVPTTVRQLLDPTRETEQLRRTNTHKRTQTWLLCTNYGALKTKAYIKALA